MATAPSEIPQTRAIDRVARLTEVIADGGNRAQELRRIPDDTISTLVDEGFFRFTLPEELGGENASITETIEVLEALAAIDASVGWNVMLGSEINAMAVGGMDPALAKEIYLDNPRVIMCGGGGPGSTPPRAEEQADGSVKVWAEATFISGCHNAEWCFLAAPIIENGAPRMDENGQPIIKMWFLNKSQWQIIDVWNMAGLRGSGSNTVRTEGGVCEAKHTGVDLMAVPAHYDNPVYRTPVPLRLAYNKAAIAIGVARGALDTFADLAQNKIPMLSAGSLATRPIAQHRMGECEGKFRAARAFLMESMRAVEDELAGGRELPSPEATQTARLACIHAANACMEVVDTIHNTAGTTGLRTDCPLERKLRDAHGCATHRWVSHSLYPEVGKIYLGEEAAPEFMGQTIR